MGGNTFGKNLKITTFGESHGAGLGVVIDGMIPGIELCNEDIQVELDKRKPGQSKFTTARNESDMPEILSGVFNNVTTGTPISILIRNKDNQSRDYNNIKDIFRPGHADFTFQKKYGIRDFRGGGRSSGRETVARVAAGAVAKKLLQKKGVEVKAFAKSIGQILGNNIDYSFINENPLRAADREVEALMEQEILSATANHDSVGGVIECHILNVPIGLGETVFDKIDALLAHAMLSIGGVKGIEFGAGFEVAKMLGSQNNDEITSKGFKTNNAGGILGGMSNGEPIVFRIAVKPTPSIGIEQNSIDINNNDIKCKIGGRHDPCLVPRVVAVVEAMATLVIADLILEDSF